MMPPDPNTPDWLWGTYEGAELNSLLRGLRRPFREKVIWLEEAETLTIALRNARANADAVITPEASGPPGEPST